MSSTRVTELQQPVRSAQSRSVSSPEQSKHHARTHSPAQVIVHARDGHIRTAYAYADTPAAAPGERGRKAGEHGGVF
ncbi:hypothetical protein ACFWP3_37980 [Streptomyces sp. NPDC058525]|uniref:hypothetical protein n=1 Tax=Streptomyces sp. NPDC058525 TaxID=3346538 RepID=UPI00364A080C